MKKLLFVLVFLPLLVSSQNVNPCDTLKVIDTVEFQSFEFGDQFGYMYFNSLNMYDYDYDEPLNFTFGEDCIGWNESIEKIYTQMVNGEVMVGEKYIIAFYLKKNRVWEGGLEWGEWKVKLVNYLLDIRKL
jgi:hypothetical protein